MDDKQKLELLLKVSKELLKGMDDFTFDCTGQSIFSHPSWTDLWKAIELIEKEQNNGH